MGHVMVVSVVFLCDAQTLRHSVWKLLPHLTLQKLRH